MTASRRRQPAIASGAGKALPLPFLQTASQVGRLGGDDEDWTAPRHDELAAQPAEQWAGGSAHEPGGPGRQHWHAGAEGHTGPAAHHVFELPPHEQAQQAAEEAAGTAAAVALGGDAEQQQEGRAEQHPAGQQQPVEPRHAAEQEQQLAAEQQQPAEQQPEDPAAGVPAPQQHESAEQQQPAGGTDAADEQQPEQQQQQPELPPLKCAVINNVSTHLDVAAGLAWALQVRHSCVCMAALLPRAAAEAA